MLCALGPVPAQHWQGLVTSSLGSSVPSSEEEGLTRYVILTRFLSFLPLLGRGKPPPYGSRKKVRTSGLDDFYHISQLDNYIILNNLPSLGLSCLSIKHRKAGANKQGFRSQLALPLEKLHFHLFSIIEFCMRFHQTEWYLLLRKKKKRNNKAKTPKLIFKAPSCYDSTLLLRNVIIHRPRDAIQAERETIREPLETLCN